MMPHIQAIVYTTIGILPGYSETIGAAITQIRAIRLQMLIAVDAK
jgi:hypothetical protein